MKPNSISEAQDVKAETLQKDYLESEIKTTTTKTEDDAKMKRNGKHEQKKKKKKYKRTGKAYNHCSVVTTEMKRHLVKHKKIKPFKCDQCEIAFDLKFNTFASQSRSRIVFLFPMRTKSNHKKNSADARGKTRGRSRG